MVDIDRVKYGELVMTNRLEEEVLNGIKDSFHRLLDSMTYILIQQRRVI